MTQQEAFQAVCDALGWDTKTLTASSRARIGKVAKELVEAGATVEQVLFVPVAWPRVWGKSDDTPTLTDTAIVSWWPALLQQWKRHDRLEGQRLEEAVETKEMFDNALPLEENRRRWLELMRQVGALKDLPE